MDLLFVAPTHLNSCLATDLAWFSVAWSALRARDWNVHVFRRTDPIIAYQVVVDTYLLTGCSLAETPPPQPNLET